LWEVLNELKYTDTHEWVRLEESGIVATVGLTSFATDKLGEILAVKLPDLDIPIDIGDELVVIESSKMALDILSPVAGSIVATNEELIDSPILINKYPYSDGWLFKVSLSDVADMDELLTPQAYLEILDALKQ